MGRDDGVTGIDTSVMQFQSTLPAWGETRLFECTVDELLQISIHSPRMGRDLQAVLSRSRFSAFQSTLPAWGETA